MYKVMALLRTLFLLFIIVYTLWVAPPWDGVTASVQLEAWHRLQGAAWMAIAWIAFETLLGWIVAAFRKPRAPAPDMPRAATAGRPAPPPPSP